MTAEALGTIFAGVGSYFVGMKLLKDNLMEMYGDRIENVIVTYAKTPLFAGLW